MSSNPSSVAAKFKLQIKESAAKELGSLGNKKDRERIATRINSLATDPRPPGSEKLAGNENKYRVRQGNYRIVYSIDDQRRTILIVKIGDRKEVYR
jgi:mRNA interferase RelE/StbE